MGLGVLFRGAMADVDGVLKHRESVLYQMFAKSSGILALLFCLGRQVEKHHYPHNLIFAESGAFSHYSKVG